MKNDYPVMLKMNGKKVVIVGGGKIALRKAKGFQDTGASVTVVSPKVEDGFHDLSFVTWKEKCFEARDLEGAHLIFAATDDKKVNSFVKQCANEYQWVDIVSQGTESSFYTPAVIRRGKLVLTVSTSGTSPTLSKKIKAEMEDIYGETYAHTVEEYANKRKK